MKKLILLVGVLLIAFLGYAAIAVAGEASVFDNVQKIIIRAYTSPFSTAQEYYPPGPYSIYLEVRNSTGALLDSEIVRMQDVTNGTPATLQSSDSSHAIYLVNDQIITNRDLSLSFDDKTGTTYLFCRNGGLMVMKYDISLTTPINGECVTYTQGLTEAPDDDDLCVAGEPSEVVGNGPWYWTCQGINPNSTNDDCSAQLMVDGQCGSLNHQTVLSLPTSLTEFCSAGTRTALTTTPTGWTWTCSGDYGGNNATNCSATQQIANIDLIVSGVTGMVSGSSPGWPLYPSVTVKNTGGDTTGSFNLKIYWSPLYPYPTSVVPSSATLLATQRVTALSGGQSKTLPFNFTVPAGAVLHKYYYVLYVVDADSEVAEKNETNNIRIGSFFVQ
jgi:hypothetical protein